MTAPEHGPGVVVVFVLTMAAMLAYFVFSIGPAKDRCDQRGGEPIIDDTLTVRCVEPGGTR